MVGCSHDATPPLHQWVCLRPVIAGACKWKLASTDEASTSLPAWFHLLLWLKYVVSSAIGALPTWTIVWCYLNSPKGTPRYLGVPPPQGSRGALARLVYLINNVVERGEINSAWWTVQTAVWWRVLRYTLASQVVGSCWASFKAGWEVVCGSLPWKKVTGRWAQRYALYYP